MTRSRAERDDEQERPGKKRKKKNEQPEAGLSRGLIIAIVGCVGVTLIGLTILIVVLVKRSGGKSMAVDSYAVYESTEYEFRCLYPQGWKMQGGGPPNHRFASFEQGSASIRINQSILGSIIGDTAGASSDPNASDDRQPVARVHEFKKPIFAQEMGDNCKEEAAQTIMTKGFGKARRSGFTTSALLKNKRGYRATVLATLVSYDIVCQGSESDWATLEPVFAKVIESMGPGTGE